MQNSPTAQLAFEFHDSTPPGVFRPTRPLQRHRRYKTVLEKLKPEDALHFLEEGRFVSTGGVLTGMKTEPYYNPYIMNPTKERLDLHRRYFEHLLKLVPCYLVNTGADKRSKVIERLVALTSK